MCVGSKPSEGRAKSGSTLRILATRRRTLASGDTVLFVTDGITEAHNREGRLYSTEDFQEFLETQRGRSAADLADNIVREVSEFAQGEPQTDDRTVLAMHIKDGGA